MPNWCENFIKRLSHEDNALLTEFIRALKANEKPTFWNDDDGNYELVINDDNFGYDEIADGFFFNSRWSPPIENFDVLVSKGFSIRVLFQEEANEVLGVYDNGVEYFNLENLSPEQIEATIPQDLNLHFGIASRVRHRIENEEDDETTGDE